MKIFNKLREAATVRKALTIQLTDAEYGVLIRATDMGGSVYGIMGDLVDKEFKPIGDAIDSIQSKLLEHAHEFGMLKQVVEFEGKPVLDDGYCAATMEDLSEYEDMAMWQGLANYFAKRDLSRRYSKQDWEKLDDRARIHLLYDAEERWTKEFDDHGFDRLELVVDADREK